MKALTLWQPYASAVFLPGPDPKDVENRTWCPPARVLGQRIAIHAGSGATGVAAVAEGMRPLLIERDPRWARVCEQNLVAALAQGSLVLGGEA